MKRQEFPLATEDSKAAEAPDLSRTTEGMIEIARRCDNADLEYEWLERPRGGTPMLGIQFPNGQGKRRVSVVDSEADDLLSYDFETFSFLGDYDGFCNRSTGEIEANFNSDTPAYMSHIPGAEEVDPETIKDRDFFISSRKMYSFVVNHEGLSVELSPASSAFTIASGFVDYTLKIRGCEYGTQAKEIEQLERFALNLFLSIEVNLDIACRLVQSTRRRVRRGPVRDAASIAFPRIEYAKEPLSLFLYGRSVPQLPLLEFLSYYQVLEYFFPIYSQREAIVRIRHELLNPAFSVSTDGSITRLIAAATPSLQTNASEISQLKHTIRGVITESDVREYLDSDVAITEYFRKNAQVLKDCPKVSTTDSHTNLLDQVAERMYDVRCRIVHTKQDGGAVGKAVLVATSPEVKLIGRDIDLARLLARRAVIASGSPS